MRQDLVALVADGHQRITLETLLGKRQAALGIRPITYKVLRHPESDPGVYRGAPVLLESSMPESEHALVMLDYDGSGVHISAEALRRDLSERLQQRGWPTDACEVIVVQPELEVWVWSSSYNVPQVLRTTRDDIHAIARRHRCWIPGHPKPHQPKKLLHEVLHQGKRKPSAAVFEELAMKVSLAACQDPAFLLLRDTLARWFPAP